MLINTNTASLFGRRTLSSLTDQVSNLSERLASGLRINSAKDDAAGTSIAERLQAQLQGSYQARRNANDAVSLAQTAEGALQTSTEVLQRIRVLALQSANDTNSAEDRKSLQEEVKSLLVEFDRIANTTSFNEKKLLDGTALTAVFQVGANKSETIQLGVQSAQASNLYSYELQTEVSTSASMVAAQAATSDGSSVQKNRLQAQNITIVSKGLTGKAVLQSGLSAKEVAARVNASLPIKGTTVARAETYAVMSMASTATASLDFKLNGVSIQSYSENGTQDLNNVINSINDKSVTTGVVASRHDMGGGNYGVLLHASQGEDISLTEFNIGLGSAGATGTVSVQGVYENGSNSFGSAGAAVALTAGNLSSQSRNTTVGGRVIFSHDSAFTISHSVAGSTGGLFAVSSTALVACTKGNALNTLNVETTTGANSALRVVDAALARVNLFRERLGSIQNRFDFTISALATRYEQQSSSLSRVQDADFAETVSQISRVQTIQQAATAMLAQANTSKKIALNLLT